MTFTPNGRTHTILQRLSQGSCNVGDLFAALGYEDPVEERHRKKFWRLSDVLTSRDLVLYSDRVFEIRPAGEALLADLEQQAPGGVGRPSVRVFAERRAA